jgi:hypothetical protein
MSKLLSNKIEPLILGDIDRNINGHENQSNGWNGLEDQLSLLVMCIQVNLIKKNLILF